MVFPFGEAGWREVVVLDPVGGVRERTAISWLRMLDPTAAYTHRADCSLNAKSLTVGRETATRRCGVARCNHQQIGPHCNTAAAVGCPAAAPREPRRDQPRRHSSGSDLTICVPSPAQPPLDVAGVTASSWALHSAPGMGSPSNGSPDHRCGRGRTAGYCGRGLPPASGLSTSWPWHFGPVDRSG